jgi:hypothetical protein
MRGGTDPWHAFLHEGKITGDGYPPERQQVFEMDGWFL